MDVKTAFLNGDLDEEIYMLSEQDEDNNSKWEQEQEVEDHWTTSSIPMVSL